MTVTDSCLQFDTKDNKWKESARMNDTRKFAACAVFEGKIVVTGGWDENLNDLNTVESYDVFSDTWSPMQNMIERKRSHSLVVVENKLFVIGRNNSEVFDSSCGKFIFLKSPDCCYLQKAISVGNKIFVFRNFNNSTVVYDVDKDKWSEQPGELTKNNNSYACVKLPIY